MSRGDIGRPKPDINEASVSIVTMSSSIFEDNGEGDWEVARQKLGLPIPKLTVERRSTDQMCAQVCKAIGGRLFVQVRGQMLRPRREHAVGYDRMRQS
jgi:hypothetical protein